MAAMMYKWLLICGLWCVVSNSAGEASFSTAKHPFYVSVTTIDHNAPDKLLEVTCKVFADDLEAILEKNYKTTLDITAEKDQAQFDKLIPDYFNRSLTMTVDGKAVKFSYIGFEVEKESVYCYFQVENVASVKKIDVSNGILYDYADSQINIMHVTVNGTRKSTKVAYPERSASFAF